MCNLTLITVVCSLVIIHWYHILLVFRYSKKQKLNICISPFCLIWWKLHSVCQIFAPRLVEITSSSVAFLRLTIEFCLNSNGQRQRERRGRWETVFARVWWICYTKEKVRGYREHFKRTLKMHHSISELQFTVLMFAYSDLFFLFV